MHTLPHGRRNLGQFGDVPPVPRTRHPHRLEPNPHRCTARRMADKAPDNPTTRHHPQTDGGTRGSAQGARPHCRLHPATHPRGRSLGHCTAQATEGSCQDSRTAHLPRPHIPAAFSHPAPDGPGPAPQTPILPTMRTYPATYHPARDPPPPSLHIIHQAQHRHGAHKHYGYHTHTPASMRAPQAPMPHTTVRSQVPPTTSHRVPPLCAPTATTNGPTLQPRLLGLPRSRTPPYPLPPLRGPQPPPPRATRSPGRAPPRQPTQLLGATHRHPPGPRGRALRGGRRGPCVDHCHGHGRRTGAPPQPAPTPQRGRLERGGPPHPSRPLPPQP